MILLYAEIIINSEFIIYIKIFIQNHLDIKLSCKIRLFFFGYYKFKYLKLIEQYDKKFY
jgi:hypothetical protein